MTGITVSSGDNKNPNSNAKETHFKDSSSTSAAEAVLKVDPALVYYCHFKISLGSNLGHASCDPAAAVVNDLDILQVGDVDLNSHSFIAQHYEQKNGSDGFNESMNSKPSVATAQPDETIGRSAIEGSAKESRSELPTFAPAMTGQSMPRPLSSTLDTLATVENEPIVLPNGIPATTVTAPDLLPLIDLSQEDMNVIVRQVNGGVANIQDIYPLSSLQDGILFHHLMDTKGDPYL
ncbi:hypothetical protein BGZ83_002386, partial [Gryganskiella cystojenkinii]